MWWNPISIKPLPRGVVAVDFWRNSRVNFSSPIFILLLIFQFMATCAVYWKNPTLLDIWRNGYVQVVQATDRIVTFVGTVIPWFAWLPRKWPRIHDLVYRVYHALRVPKYSKISRMAKIDTVQRNEKWFLSLRIFLFSSFFFSFFFSKLFIALTLARPGQLCGRHANEQCSQVL